MDEITKACVSVLRSEGYGCTEDSEGILVDDAPFTVSSEMVERVLKAAGLKGVSVVKEGKCVRLEVDGWLKSYKSG